MRKKRIAAENAFSDELDIDLTDDNEFSSKELDIAFNTLVPEGHKYNKHMKAIYSNIVNARIKPNTYERFFFNLLLDNP